MIVKIECGHCLILSTSNRVTASFGSVPAKPIFIPKALGMKEAKAAAFWLRSSPAVEAKDMILKDIPKRHYKCKDFERFD